MQDKLYLFCGDDDYLVDAAARECIARLMPEADRAVGVEIIEGDRDDRGDAIAGTLAACMESVQTPGFFGSAKLTWLRNATFFAGGSRGSESQAAREAITKFGQWLKGGLLDGQLLVITAGRIARNSVVFKSCKANGAVQDFGNDLRGRELEERARELLQKLLREAGITASSAVVGEFLMRVGFDGRTLVSEVGKLALYIHPRTNLQVEDVRQIVSLGREAESWDVVDAFGARNAITLLKALHTLPDPGKQVIALCAMLEKRVREMLVLREALEQRWVTGSGWRVNLTPEAEIVLKMLPFDPKAMPSWLLRQRLQQAEKYSLRELRVARAQLATLRERLVSTALPALFLLETTLLRIMGKPGGAAGRGGRWAQ